MVTLTLKFVTCIFAAAILLGAAIVGGVPSKQYALASLTTNLTAIDMTGSQTGWAEYSGGIARTSDGGQRWIPVSPSRYSISIAQCADYQSANALFALNSTTAWVLFHCVNSHYQSQPATIWYTTTSGSHWKSFSIPSNLSNQAGLSLSRTVYFRFASASIGWIGVLSTDGVSPTLVALLRTTDSGQAWTILSKSSAPSHLLGAPGPNKAYGFNDAVDKPEFGENYSDFPNSLSVTSSGGGPWVRHSLPAPPGFKHAYLSIGSAGFSGARSATIPVAGWIGGTPVHPQHRFCATYRTNNGGANWSYANTSEVGCAGGESEIEYLNASDGWSVPGLASGSLKLYKTTDGGQTWQIDGRIPTSQVDQWDWITPRDGFIISGRMLFRTTDGGLSWKQIDAQLSDGPGRHLSSKAHQHGKLFD